MLCLALCWGLCTAALAEGGLQVIPPRYDAAGDFSEGLAWVRVGDYKTGKYGYIDRSGKEVVPLKYDDAGDFSGGLAIVRIGEYGKGKAGVVDKSGEEVVPLKYDAVWHFGEDVLAVKLGGKWGFVDKTDKEIVPCKYDQLYELTDGLARVGIEQVADAEDGDADAGFWGFVDAAGREVIPCRYSRVGEDGDWRWEAAEEHPFSEGLAAAWLPGDEADEKDGGDAGKWGVIDEAGNVVAPFELPYDDAEYFHEGLMAVMEIDQAGYRDAVGNGKTDDGEAGEEEEDEDEEDEEEYVGREAALSLYAKVGFIDATGKLVIPLMYSCPYYLGNGCLEPRYILPKFSEGLAAVMNGDRQEERYSLGNNGKFGYIDREGKVVIPFIYDYAAPFSEGLAYVCQGDQYGFIDKTGKVIVPLDNACDYDHGCAGEGGLLIEQHFSGGFARIRKSVPEADMQYGLVDKTGSIVVPPQYAWLDWDADALAIAYAGDYPYEYSSAGLAVLSGGEAVLIDRYDDVREFSAGFAAVARRQDDALEWGFVDTSGREVVPCAFQDARGFSEGLAAVLVDGKWGYIALDE